MKKPYMTLSPPFKRDYEPRTVNIVLYAYYYSMEACEFCGDYNCQSDCEDAMQEDEQERYPGGYMRYYNNLYYRRYQPKLPKINLEDMDLQKVIDLIPEGVSPKDIKMRIDLDSGDMGYYGYAVEFYYEKTLPDESEQYKTDKAAYDAERAEYLKKFEEYQTWEKYQEILKLEQQINELKKK